MITQVLCKTLSKFYGETPALRGLDLSLPAGKITTILGENGAGKSTLVGLLAGSILPTRGSIVTQRADGSERALGREEIGLIAHQTLLYAELSGRENLSLYGGLYGCTTEDIEKVIVRCSLGRYVDRPVREYSRGMAQRTAIARALLHRPALLLCDEPYTGLDPAGSSLLDTLLQEQRAAGVVVVLVVHDLSLAARLSDRIVMLRQGKRLCVEEQALSAEELLGRLQKG